MIPWISSSDPFPPVSSALTEPDGLLAVGADLSPQRIIDAYCHGIFPWFNTGQPILWWSTDPRMVLHTEEFHVPHVLRRRLAQIERFALPIEVRTDTSFEAVMRACAAPRAGQGSTWINEAMIASYVELHRMGIAHSVETWVNGTLVGGLYGLGIGRMFYGESMFTRATDASKIALAHLVRFARAHKIPMIDCQQQTAHLASLGARPVARAEFVLQVADLVNQPGISDWSMAWNQLFGRSAP